MLAKFASSFVQLAMVLHTAALRAHQKPQWDVQRGDEDLCLISLQWFVQRRSLVVFRMIGSTTPATELRLSGVAIKYHLGMHMLVAHPTKDDR